MFSATDAAFSGFRAAREHPKAVLVWTVFVAVVSTLLAVLAIKLGGPALMMLQEFGASTEPQTDPAEAMRMMAGMAPMILILTPISLIYYAVLYAAANRIILRPGEAGRAYLGLGADEFRQLGLLILLFLLFMAVYVAGVVVASIIGAVAMVANQALGAFVMVLAFVAVVAGMLVFAVKLSLSSAQTFDLGKVRVFGSWALTKGHFWPLLGAYVLAAIMAIIVGLLGYTIFVALAVVLGGGFEAVGSFMQPDMSSLGAYFTPARIAYIPFGAAIAVLTTLIMLCPAPTIYRQLTAGRAEA